ncbi:MAG: sacsin N-terminal ATP-binding-like domain-containing protein [Syntrophales bacterium]
MTPQNFQTEIIRKTTGEIRTFLAQLAYETSGYKSLHNLTEQVEHQYHGRFLIELIQNAHDAMNEHYGSGGDQGRLEILIERDEAPYGSLYVANDGLPFTKSNFECLSQLGQSDKDPEKSIGNKGIGFRSVLEISNSPEIYSRSSKESETFDGYCFYFSPDVTKLFAKPILKLIQGDDKPCSPLDGALPLIEWSRDQLLNFRSLYSSKDDQWLSKELKYLSPYLLPLPIRPSQKIETIKAFERQGFASVIRLPFKSEAARDYAITMTQELDENTILFLERIQFLSLNSGDKLRLVERKMQPLSDSNNGQEIRLEVIEDGAEGNINKKYWLWSVTMGGDENQEEREEITKAIIEDDLPGRWPELTKAIVSLAVRVDGELEQGRINIYLPTQVPTGCAAHFNGPFFGDMSRTDIKFEKKFNTLLRKRICHMAVEVILESLAGKDVDHGRAIIDILAPSTEEAHAGSEWFNVIKEACEEKELNLVEQPIMLTDKDWMSIGYASLIPEIDSPKVLTPDALREQATFYVIHKDLIDRKDVLASLFKAFGINPFPLSEDLAATVENIAKELHKAGEIADWNGFWYDLNKLFKGNAEPLKGKRILLGNDLELHASGPDCTIFFPPRQGVDDDEIQTDGASSDIPQSLQDCIAFIDDRIEIYSPKDARQQTLIRKFVESSLVERYRVVEIIRSVLLPKIPPLPVQFRDRNSHLCRDILLWGLRLVTGMPDRGRGRSGTLQLLRHLPVPCHGGWYTIEQSLFGPGWPNTAGTDVFEYLSGANTKACQEELNRMLLPPTDKLWEGRGEQYKDILELSGSFNGLRLKILQPEKWESRKLGDKHSYKLPALSPPCIPLNLWEKYTDLHSPKIRARMYYASDFFYEVQSLLLIPGLERYADFDEKTRLALMNSLFASMHKWDKSWIATNILKADGIKQSIDVESPLVYCLKSLSWIAIDSEGKKEWELPSRRWYIPKDCLAGRSWQYGHLRPLPGVLADKIDRNPALFDQGLAYLGMPKFVPDSEDKSNNTRLLDDLAAALDSDIPDRNMFLSHIRVAWSNYDAVDADSFPDRIIISNGPKQLLAIEPDVNYPIYLPDSTASFVSELNQFSLPVIEINSSDAKRLSAQFKQKYGTAVRLASEMRVWPIAEDQSWTTETGTSLSESELGWLPTVLVTLYAFIGSPPPGIYTKKISSSVQILREAKLVWTSSLRAGLWMGDEIIANPPVAAMWISQDKILICDTEFKDQMSKYSEALKTLIDRDDLELPLKHVLEKIELVNTPTHEDICIALQSLKIQRSQYDQAYDLWQGDLGQIIRMLMPVIALLKPDAEIGVIADIGTEEDLLIHLQELEITKPTPQEIIGLIRSSDDYFMLGEGLFEILGNTAQLDRWNDALARVGTLQLLNKNAEEEYRTHIRSAQALIEATVAHIMRRSGEGSSFDEILERLEHIPFSEALASQFWEIEFEHAIPGVVPLFEGLSALPTEISAIITAKSIEELKDNLSLAGIETTVSPLVIHQKNHESFRNILAGFIKIAVAASIKKNISPLPWEKSPDELLSHFEEFFKHKAYLNNYSDDEFFELLKSLPRDTAQADFWNTVDQSANLESLMTSLSLSVGDITGADKELEKYKDLKRKQNRLAAVCGKEFDYSEENLSQLWSHLVSQIEENVLPKVELKNLSILAAIAKKQKKTKTTTGGKGDKHRGRTSKEMEHLIGFAGEIHTYRMLTKTYGAEVMHPGTWKSSYSKRVFPGNNPDDNIGCDFIIDQKKLTYHIEVKSSLDDNESFELGSSEIRTAMEMTRKRKGHVFMIMHVYNALSNNPGFRLLPNPYDPKSQGVYVIEDAGARIRYRLK